MRAKGRIEALAGLFLRTPRTVSGTGHLLSAQRAATAAALVSAFYAILAYFAFVELYHWPRWLESTALTPRWPVAWLDTSDPQAGIGFILGLHLVAAIVGVAAPRFAAVRVLVFVSWLEFLAFKYSFGSINHGDHLGLLLSFALIFLPAGWSAGAAAARRVRVATLLVFSGCQALILMTYSMAGLWKLVGVVRQMVAGEVHALSVHGLAYQIAAKLLSSDATSVLGPWLIAHPGLGWLSMAGALYLQFSALWIVARPSLHRLWGLGLILVHLMSHLTIGVGFAQNCL